MTSITIHTTSMRIGVLEKPATPPLFGWLRFFQKCILPLVIAAMVGGWTRWLDGWRGGGGRVAKWREEWVNWRGQINANSTLTICLRLFCVCY